MCMLQRRRHDLHCLHGVLCEGASLVGTDDVDTAEGLHCGEVLGYHMTFGHPHDPQGKCDSHYDRQPLRDGSHCKATHKEGTNGRGRGKGGEREGGWVEWLKEKDGV